MLGPLAGIGAFGAHIGGHPEGLDHIWLEVAGGIPIRSWARGTVTKIEDMQGEYHITIEYEGGLSGRHMEVKTCLVSVGQTVNAGDPVCYGLTFGNMQSAEFQLMDSNRNDGVTDGNNRAYVSPFDYLRSDIKASLESAYRSIVIQPYLSQGLRAGNNNPFEPYLTNPVLFHKKYKRTLAGEWILSGSHWGTGGFPDILVFQDVNNEYYTGKRVVAADDSGEGQLVFDGTWSADSTLHRFSIISNGTTYYGIYEIDESGARATLKIEYSTTAYPQNFSAVHGVYKERDNLPRRFDAEKLGVY